MAVFRVNDKVLVRASNKHTTWWNGVVTSNSAGPNGGSYEVTFITPISVKDWMNRSNKRMGDAMLTKVYIHKHQEKLDPSSMIKAK